jgi:hypothetical protein
MTTVRDGKLRCEEAASKFAARAASGFRLAACRLGIAAALMAAGWTPLQGTSTAMAQEFRIETEVTSDSRKEQSLTIFSGDVVYDFLLGSAPLTTVFDMRRGEIKILDPQQKIRTSLTTVNLLELTTAMIEVAATRSTNDAPDPIFAPHFDIQYDDARLLVTLTSVRINYRAKGVTARHPDAVKRYQQFADWYARLNALRSGNVPPFGRIELNKALAERNLIPEEIERTIVTKGLVTSQKSTARSVHTVNWLISNSDRTRIDAVGKQLTSFEHVPPQRILQPEAMAATK